MHSANSTRSEPCQAGGPRSGQASRVADVLVTEFSATELWALGQLGTLVQVAAGGDLVLEGSVGRDAFVVVAGTGQVATPGGTMTSIGTGAVFGEAALIDSEVTDASVIATTTLSIFVLSRAELASLLSKCPRLSQSLQDLVVRRQAWR